MDSKIAYLARQQKACGLKSGVNASPPSLIGRILPRTTNFEVPWGWSMDPLFSGASEFTCPSMSIVACAVRKSSASYCWGWVIQHPSIVSSAEARMLQGYFHRSLIIKPKPPASQASTLQSLAQKVSIRIRATSVCGQKREWRNSVSIWGRKWTRSSRREERARSLINTTTSGAPHGYRSPWENIWGGW